MSVKINLFHIHTEYHLLLSANIISNCYSDPDSFRNIIFFDSSNQRLTKDYNLESISAESLTFDSTKVNDVKEAFRNLFEIHPYRFFSFQEISHFDIYLNNKFKSGSTINCLVQDGTNPYVRYNKKYEFLCSVKDTLNLHWTLFRYRLYLSSLHLFWYYKYGSNTDIDELWLTHPESLPVKVPKLLVKIPEFRGPAIFSRIKQLFGFNLEKLGITDTRNVIFYANQPFWVPEHNLVELQFIKDLLDKFHDLKRVYIKLHPMTSLTVRENLNRIEKVTIIESRIPAEVFIQSLNDSIIISPWSTSLITNNEECNFYYIYPIFRPDRILLQSPPVNPAGHVSLAKSVDDITLPGVVPVTVKKKAKKILFFIHTEYHLLVALNSVCSEQGDNEITFLISTHSVFKRFREGLDYDYESFPKIKFLFIELNDSFRSESEHLHETVKKILEEDFYSYIFFNDNVSLAVHLAYTLSRKGTRICLAQDGLKAYVKFKKTGARWRTMTAIGNFRYLRAHRIPGIEFRIPSLVYGSLKEVDELWLTHPEKYSNKTNKTLRKVSLLSNEETSERLNKFFRFSRSWYPEGNSPVMFFINQPIRDRRIQDFEIELLGSLKNTFSNYWINLKLHPSSDLEHKERLKNIPGIRVLEEPIPAELFCYSLIDSIILSFWSTTCLYENPKCKTFWLHPMLKERGIMINYYTVTNPTEHIVEVKNINELKSKINHLAL